MNKTVKEVHKEYGLSAQLQCKIRKEMKPPLVMRKEDYRGRVISFYTMAQVSQLLSAKSLFITKLNDKKVLAKLIRELN